MSRARINRGFFNFQQCLNAPNLSVIRCRKSYAGRNRPPAATEGLGRIGGCREAGYAAGLVPKAHRQQVRRIEVSQNSGVVPELTRKPSGWWCGWRRKIPGGAISSVFLRTSVARRFGGAEQNSSSAQTVRGFSRGTISRVGASNCRCRFGNGARTLRIYFSSNQAGDGRGPRPRPGRILPLLDKSPRRENRGG